MLPRLLNLKRLLQLSFMATSIAWHGARSRRHAAHFELKFPAPCKHPQTRIHSMETCRRMPLRFMLRALREVPKQA